jgi:ABC-type transport system substrate-binding protein
MVLIMKKRTRNYFLLLIFLTLTNGIFFLDPALAEPDEEVNFIALCPAAHWIYYDPWVKESYMGYSIDYLTWEPLVWHEIVANENPGQVVPIPWLAESWTIFNDNSVNISLRQDVYFSNGMPFNSSVVKWNFEKCVLTGLPYGGSDTGYPAGWPSQARMWYRLEDFLPLGDNMKYNDSDDYPNIWWNKDGARHVPSQWNGLNDSRIADESGDENDLQWPEDWKHWKGTPIWDPEPILRYNVDGIDGNNIVETFCSWDGGNTSRAQAYTNLFPCMWDSYEGEKYDMGMYDPWIITYPDDPYTVTVHWSLPLWNTYIYKIGQIQPMVYPDGTWNEAKQYWDYDGPMCRDEGLWPQTMHGKVNSTWVTDVIGTGMFVMETVDPVELIWTFSTNENYWGGNYEDTERPGPIAPAYDNLIIRGYPDENAYYSAALGGDVDYFPLVGATGPDYVETIANLTSLTLAEPTPNKFNLYFTINPHLVNKTIRRAMNFGFNYDHYIENIGGFLYRSKGPGQSNMQYSTYADNNQRTFPGQVENGFNYNVTEARRILLEETTAAADRGLTAASNDAAWQAVAESDNPIENVSVSDFATNPSIFQFLKTYWNNIGIWIEQYGPIAGPDIWPYEMTMHRWSKDVQWMRMGHAYPNMFDFYNWYWHDHQINEDFDFDGISNLFDDNWSQTLNWNQWALTSSLINLNDSDLSYVRDIQGRSSFEPTSRNLLGLILSLPLTLEDVQRQPTPALKAQVEQQLEDDVSTLLDYIYTEAIAIWYAQEINYFAYNPERWVPPEWWTAPAVEGFGLWDFQAVVVIPVIPGYPLGIFTGISLIAVIAVAVITRKRRIVQ